MTSKEIFQHNIKALYGEQGESWLLSLPVMVEEFSKKWGLSEVQEIKNLSYHYVVSAFQDKTPVVLKLGLDVDELAQENHALQALAGFGVPRVMQSTSEALLLEQAVPGVSLKSYFPCKDEEATQIACRVIERLHRAPKPKGTSFPHIRDWLSIIDKEWNIPQPILEKARRLKNQLLAASSQEVLLHGDLHHDNILENGDDWMVIDPKGVMGDPIIDKMGCLLREPLSELLTQENTMAILNKRLKLIAHYFSLDREKIIQWTFVQSVLACCWFLEDNQSSDKMIEFIGIVDKLI